MNKYGLAKPGKRIVTINMVQAERPAPPKPKPAAGGSAQQSAASQAAPQQSAAAQAAPSAAPSAARTAAIRQAVSKKGLLGVLGGRDVIKTRRTASSLDSALATATSSGSGWGSGSGSGGGTGTGTGDGWAGMTVDTTEVLTTEEKTVATATPRVAKLEQRKDAKVESVDTKQPQDLSTQEAINVVKRTVDTYLGGLRYVYNRELRKNPDLEGKITIAITINPQGVVEDAKLVESTMNAPEMEQAIVARVRKWTFPPVAPKTITVTYPFVFFPTM